MVRDGEDVLLDGVDLAMMLNALPTTERVVLALILAGYKHAEIGVIIGMTRAAVGAINKRAVFRLQMQARKD